LLAERLKKRDFHNPLVLAIPRGGVVVAAVLAETLGAELDVALARKLRAPGHPEYALGSVGEDGQVYLNPDLKGDLGLLWGYLARERRYQLAEIARRRKLFRGDRPRAPVMGRSVLVTDDGIATGSTMIAALRAARAQGPRELIVVVPVAPPDRLEEVRTWCDEAVCVLCPAEFRAVGEFYEDFTPIEDAQVVELLGKFTPASVSPRTS
jgi:putative phosphoribosyl transferase